MDQPPAVERRETFVVAAGALQVAGDMGLLRRFMRLFPLPPEVVPR